MRVILAIIAVIAAPARGEDYLDPLSETVYHAQEVRGGFLARSAGARSAGMGEAFTAVADDATGPSANPGGIAQVKAPSGALMYGALGNGMGLNYAAVAVPVDVGAVKGSVFGLEVIVLSYGSYDVRDASGAKLGTDSPADVGVTLSWGFENAGWMILDGYTGLGVDVVSEDAAGGAMYSFDLGTLWLPTRRLNVGWTVQHLGPKREGFALPAILKVGAAYAFLPELRCSLDMGYPVIDRQAWGAVGVEYVPARLLTVRAGYAHRAETAGINGLRGLTAGAGVRFRGFGIDYAYQPFGDLATIHRFSLTYGSRPEFVRKEAPAPERFVWPDEPTGNIEEPEPKPMPPRGVAGGEEDDFRAAEILYANADYDGALARALAAVAVDPRHWRAWAVIGNCRHVKGDGEGALEAYDRSLRINPSNEKLQGWVNQLRNR